MAPVSSARELRQKDREDVVISESRVLEVFPCFYLCMKLQSSQSHKSPWFFVTKQEDQGSSSFDFNQALRRTPLLKCLSVQNQKLAFPPFYVASVASSVPPTQLRDQALRRRATGRLKHSLKLLFLSSVVACYRGKSTTVLPTEKKGQSSVLFSCRLQRVQLKHVVVGRRGEEELVVHGGGRVVVTGAVETQRSLKVQQLAHEVKVRGNVRLFSFHKVVRVIE